MGKGVVLAALTVWLVAIGPATGSGQVADIQATEQAYYEQVMFLRANITQLWTPVQVLGVMGEPDRQSSFFDGPVLVEVWGYRGYEVRIEFRNGLASSWFFRFMP